MRERIKSKVSSPVHLKERAEFDGPVQGIFPVDAMTLLMYQLTQLQHLLQRLHLCLQCTLRGLAARRRCAILLLGVAGTRHVAYA